MVMDYEQMVKAAIAAFEAMTPEEQAAHREEQKISWAYGQVALSYPEGHCPISRDQVARLVRRGHL